jgi:hypothetical protein
MSRNTFIGIPICGSEAGWHSYINETAMCILGPLTGLWVESRNPASMQVWATTSQTETATVCAGIWCHPSSSLNGRLVWGSAVRDPADQDPIIDGKFLHCISNF